MTDETALVLVGGFGFVGRNILARLAADLPDAGLSPAVIDDLSNAAPGHEGLDLPHFTGPYLSEGASAFLNRRCPGRRVIVFLAGETRVAESRDRPLDFIHANIADPASFVLGAVRPGDAFVLVSTAGALFDGTAEVDCRTPVGPKNFYGATKASEELCLRSLVAMRGGTFATVRLTNVYGAFSERKKSAVHHFTRACIAGQSVTINGDGRQTRDFVFAGDVGRGILTLCRSLAGGEAQEHDVHMIGAGQSHSLLDVVAAIEAASGRTLARSFDTADALLSTEPRDVRVSRSDATALLGGQATPLTDGIARTLAWYQDTAVA